MAFQGGAVKVKQDFTDDRAKLREALALLMYGDDLNNDGIPDTPDGGTPFGQDDGEFNVFNTDRRLAALQTAITMLRPLPEQKVLLYFSERPSPHRHGQPGAAARDDQRRRARQRHRQPDRCAGPRRNGAARRCLARVSERRRVVLGPDGDVDDDRVSAVAGHAVRAGQGHGREGASRLQRSLRRHRPGSEGGDQLLHHRVLQLAYGDRRSLPPNQGDTQREPVGGTRRTGPGTTPTSHLRTSPAPTRSASSKKRSCSRTRSPK